MDHISEEVLEQYALGNPTPDHVEDHLLICETCQEHLQFTDEFIAAMRAALGESKDNDNGSMGATPEDDERTPPVPA